MEKANGDATERQHDPPPLLQAIADKLRKSSGLNRLTAYPLDMDGGKLYYTHTFFSNNKESKK